MLTAPVPVEEQRRLAALLRYDVLDTDAEPAFDDIAWLAADICDAPLAFVSLVDAEREFFKAAFGSSAREAPRDISFCGHTILDDEILLVSDALRDPRFSDNPQVTSDRPVRFYAGAPLITPEGLRIGALCIKAGEPRDLDQGARHALEALARQVVAQLELRRLLVESRASAASARKLAAIVESSDDAIIGTTPSGLVRSWNASAERIYGYNAAEMIGAPIGELIPIGERAELDRLLHRVAEGERVDHHEGFRLRKDGTRVEISAAVSPVLDDDGAIAGMSIVERDLTERRALEKAKRDFVASVSHELRTPLSSIIGYVEILNEDESALPDGHRRFLAIIDANAHKLLALISDVLALSETENAAAFRPERTELGALVRAVVDDHAIGAHAQRHDVRLAVPAEPVWATVDRNQLTQGVSNLLSNAIKYTPDEGTIGVSLAIDDGSACISVTDSGIGIAEPDLPHLTERFYRAASATDAGIPGTGLGLAICAGIAAAHNGVLNVQSALGRGSEFTLSFPLEHHSRRAA